MLHAAVQIHSYVQARNQEPSTGVIQNRNRESVQVRIQARPAKLAKPNEAALQYNLIY
tara:strand:+ start:327 stop:500 length:174 start_codon:yes stop_codon:yes gene_type:complete